MRIGPPFFLPNPKCPKPAIGAYILKFGADSFHSVAESNGDYCSCDEGNSARGNTSIELPSAMSRQELAQFLGRQKAGREAKAERLKVAEGQAAMMRCA